MFLPKPANYLFYYFQDFSFWVWWRSVIGNMHFWALHSLGCLLIFIIIAAGHNGKVHTIAYLAPLVASIILVYIRRNYFWGFVSTTVFMALQIMANHPQMTYYLFIGLGFFSFPNCCALY